MSSQARQGGLGSAVQGEADKKQREDERRRTGLRAAATGE